MKITKFYSTFNSEKSLPYGLVVYFSTDERLQINVNDSVHAVITEGYYEDFFKTLDESIDRLTLVKSLS